MQGEMNFAVDGGCSPLRNVYSINRDYENIVSRLQKLGANSIEPHAS